MFHIGKVIKKYKKNSGEQTTQATLEMWDENMLTLEISQKITAQIKEGDYALVDYRPIQGMSVPVPRHIVCKILEKKEGEKMWGIYKQEFERIKRVNRPPAQPASSQYV